MDWVSKIACVSHLIRRLPRPEQLRLEYPGGNGSCFVLHEHPVRSSPTFGPCASRHTRALQFAAPNQCQERSPVRHNLSKHLNPLAGAGGFEPPYGGIKIRSFIFPGVAATFLRIDFIALSAALVSASFGAYPSWRLPGGCPGG